MMELDEMANSVAHSESPVRKKCRPSSSDRVNPFEKEVLDRLSQSVWSPTVFANVNITAETPERNEWSVDQLAHLYPRNFEDSPTSHTNPYPVDPLMEAKAQADIKG
jgi:hypothetical protein